MLRRGSRVSGKSGGSGSISHNVPGAGPRDPLPHRVACATSPKQMVEWRLRVPSFFVPSAALPPPYILQEVQVGIINTTMCNYLYTWPLFRYDIWGDMVCAGDPQGGKDSCFVSVPPHPS